MPVLTVIAGPNGSGKSTLTKWNRERFQSYGILDPDAIARSMDPSSRPVSPIDAGRVVLNLADEMLQERRSFVVETTLSGNTYLRMMRSAKSFGYGIEFLFVGTNSVEINIERVKSRVAKGGHDVSETDQRRRFPRSMQNAQNACQIADIAGLYDNSTAEGFVLLASKDESGTRVFEPLPDWAVFIRESK